MLIDWKFEDCEATRRWCTACCLQVSKSSAAAACRMMGSSSLGSDADIQSVSICCLRTPVPKQQRGLVLLRCVYYMHGGVFFTTGNVICLLNMLLSLRPIPLFFGFLRFDSTTDSLGGPGVRRRCNFVKYIGAFFGDTRERALQDGSYAAKFSHWRERWGQG